MVPVEGRISSVFGNEWRVTGMGVGVTPMAGRDIRIGDDQPIRIGAAQDVDIAWSSVTNRLEYNPLLAGAPVLGTDYIVGGFDKYVGPSFYERIDTVSRNTCFGEDAGASLVPGTTTDNLLGGHRAGHDGSGALFVHSVLLGPFAGEEAEWGYNVGIGYGVFRHARHAWYNVGIGENVAPDIHDGLENVILGGLAAPILYDGDQNIVIGRQGAKGLYNGTNNLLMGWRGSAYWDESYCLKIGDSISQQPMIDGKFPDKFINFRLHGAVEDGFSIEGDKDNLTGRLLSVNLKQGSDNIDKLQSVTNGVITVYADTGDSIHVTVTSAAHGRANGETVVILDSTNYNETFVLSGVTPGTFDIIHSWDGDDGVSEWNLEDGAALTLITAPIHGLATGNTISIGGDTVPASIRGNRTITVINVNQFTLVGTPYEGGWVDPDGVFWPQYILWDVDNDTGTPRASLGCWGSGSMLRMTKTPTETTFDEEDEHFHFDSKKLSTDGRFEFIDPTFYDEFEGGVKMQWAARVSTGALTIINKQGGWIRLTTGALATNEESLDWNDVCQFKASHQPIFEIVVKLEQVANTECDVGLMEISGAGDDHFIKIHFDASVDNLWHLTASDAGATTSDAGAAATIDETKLRFEYDTPTGEVEWFIDDASQGIVGSNIPACLLQPFIAARTEEAAAHYVEADFTKIYEDRT